MEWFSIAGHWFPSNTRPMLTSSRSPSKVPTAFHLRWWWALLIVSSLVGLAGLVQAGDVRLKNGTTIRGNPVKIETFYTGHKKPKPANEIVDYPIYMITTPSRRYFVPRFQTEEINPDVDLGSEERYVIKHDKRSGSGREIAIVGGYTERPTPFDEFGRRTVKLAVPSGEISVIQGIVEITPDTIKLASLNYKWEMAIPVSSIEPAELEAVLRHQTEPDNLDQRLKLARFFIQSQNYKAAEKELVEIGEKFPQQAQAVETVRLSLKQDRAQALLNELKYRQRSGQHTLVRRMLTQFPVDDVAPAVLSEVRQMQSEYETTATKGTRVNDQLAELQAALKSPEMAETVAPLRRDLVAQLRFSNIARLAAFANLADDPSLPAEDKMALALSGFVVGSDNATTDLGQAVNLWQARILLADYLRTTPDNGVARERIIKVIEELEGLSPERVAQLLPLLPDPVEPAGAMPGQLSQIRASGERDEITVQYSIYLPPEYQPDQAYPTIIALHGAGRTPDQEAGYWVGTESRPGQASRHGYIVIAPEYTTKTGQTRYDYTPAAHQSVLKCLADAASRFHIDHDRVFLSGHMMGGDAAFDIGFSHPHLFAGVIPMGGISDSICQIYWENAKHVPFYIILGELDRDTMSRNSREIERMMKGRVDVIVAEYIGSGPDSFSGEIHRLFEWMGRLRRERWHRKLEWKCMRNTDNQHYWVETGDIPAANRFTYVEGDGKNGPKPLRLSATMVQPANKIDISNRTGLTRFHFSPVAGFVQFDKKLQISLNGKTRFNDFLKPNIRDMLESVRKVGDRESPAWVTLEL